MESTYEKKIKYLKILKYQRSKGIIGKKEYKQYRKECRNILCV